MSFEARPVTAGPAAAAAPRARNTLITRAALWALWATLTYSYPLLALFGDSDDGGGFSLIVVPAILALGITGALGFFTSDLRTRAAVLMITALIGGINLLVFFLDSTMLTGKFVQFNLVLLLFGVVTAYSLFFKPVLDWLDIALIITGVLGLAALLLNTSSYDSGRITYGDSNPIWMSRILGFACIGVFYRAIVTQRYTVPLAPVGLVLLIGIVMTGSRGPLLSVLLAVAAGMLLYRVQNKARLILLGLAAVVMLFVILQFVGDADRTRGLSLGEADDVSYFIRISVFDYTVGLIQRYPEGIGIGNFSFYGFPYPHNIFLELLAEWGWFFGGFYMLLIVLGGVGVFLSGQRYQLLFMIFVFDIANASVSGDITSPRYLYGLTIFGLAHLVVQAYAALAPRHLYEIGPVGQAPAA